MAQTALARALAIIAIAKDGGVHCRGAALVALRRDALTGAYDGHPATADGDVYGRLIMAIDVPDMPPATDLVVVLLETLSQRLGGVSRAQTWRSIGVNSNRGRDLLARNAEAVDWPTWKVLRDAALLVPKRHRVEVAP